MTDAGPPDRPPLARGWKNHLSWLLAAPLVLILLWLVFGPKPWTDGVSVAQAAGKSVKPAHYAVTGTWFGALAALPCAIVLLLFRGRLAAPLPHPFAPSIPSLPRSQWMLFGIVALATVVTTAWLHAPRLGQSFWDDEEKAMRYFTVGRYKQQDDGTLRFKEATWTDVFFNYRQPNNHILFSIFSRASHQALAPPRDTPGRPYFDEASLRLPSFLAGLGAIVAVGLLLCSLGFQRAALWSMPLLALHPWFLRYLVEARGYSLVLFLGPLLVAALVRALDRGHARWWIAVALLQFAIFYTFPGALHFLFWLQLGALTAIWRHAGGRASRIALFTRWFAAALGTSILTTVLMGPCLPQLLSYLAEQRDQLPISATTWHNLGALLVTGSSWHEWSSENPLSLGLVERLNAAGVAGWSVAFLLLACIVAGSIRLLGKSRIHASLLPVFLLPPISFPLVAMIKEQVFYPWYAIGALPFLMALIALGADWPSRPFGQSRTATISAVISGSCAIFLFSWLSAPQRTITSEHPIEAKRDAVELIRAPHINPSEAEQANIISVGFHQENLAYDPNLHRFNDIDDTKGFDALLDEARAKNLPLFVDFAQEAYARRYFPHIFRRLDDPELFETVSILYGLESQNTRRVMKFLPTAR